MISICIPVHNYNVVDLVTTLNAQAERDISKFEIIVMDDCSDAFFKRENEELTNMSNVIYIELEENVGRARIRNQLIKKASFNNILLMDCDAKVFDDNYLLKYIKYANQNSVVCGGTAYLKTKPAKKERLRWRYGLKREVRSAEIRQEEPYLSFTSFNFMIPKSVTDVNLFDESITEYGHEDTLFGYQLMQKGVPITHIENPLIHLGLDNNYIFIKKSIVAVNSLYKLLTNSDIDKDFFESIKLLRYLHKIRKSKMLWFMNLIDILFKSAFVFIITNIYASLFLFDLIRLLEICSLEYNKYS